MPAPEVGKNEFLRRTKNKKMLYPKVFPVLVHCDSKDCDFCDLLHTKSFLVIFKKAFCLYLHILVYINIKYTTNYRLLGNLSVSISTVNTP
jgi:hypothetical protein